MEILKIFGIIFLIVSVVLSMFLVFPPTGWKPAGWAPPAPKPGAAVKADFMRNEMTKTGTFKGLWLCYTIGALAGLTAIGIAGPVGSEVYNPIHADELNMSYNITDKLPPDSPIAQKTKDWIFLLIVPFAIVNGLARPVFGTLTDKLGTKNTAILAFALIFAACMLMYMYYTSGSAYIAAFAILSPRLRGWLAIAPTATASYFGLKDNAKNYGLVFTAYGAGAVIGGIVSAQAKMLLGGYKPFFLIVAVLALLGVVVAHLMMKPPVKKAT